jgi:predicted AAA+ superfamily ATPase
MREFNVTGICVPDMHYMVDISGKIEQIFKLVEGKKYFTINRGRQYGKTTTIGMLEKRLPGEYICVGISFQYSSNEMYAHESGFCQELLELIHNALLINNEEEANLW